MPIDLDEVRKGHQKCRAQTHPPFVERKYDACSFDGRPYPCDAIQLADEVEHLRFKYAASQEEMTELLTEHRKLREALYAHKDEITRLKQERRDNFDEIKERF
jgi:hypothetical protein